MGVNRFQDSEESPQDVFPIDPKQQKEQAERVRRLKLGRDQGEVTKSLAELESVAKEGGNILYPMKTALRCYATLGEVSDVLRAVYGTYTP